MHDFSFKNFLQKFVTFSMLLVQFSSNNGASLYDRVASFSGPFSHKTRVDNGEQWKKRVQHETQKSMYEISESTCSHHYVANNIQKLSCFQLIGPPQMKSSSRVLVVELICPCHPRRKIVISMD